MARYSANIVWGTLCVALNLAAAMYGSATNALLLLAAGPLLAWEIRRFLDTERADALRFQRLLTESGHALHAPDFPALNAALKRHGVCLA